MTTTFPIGTSRFGRVVASNVITTGSIRNRDAPLRLGTVNAANTFLAVTSNVDGVHLTEFTNTKVWIDTPVNTTQLLTANGIVASSLTTSTASINGGLTAAFLVSQTSVTTNTLTASSETISGTSFHGGAASFQSTVSVIGATTLSGTLSAQATNLQSLNVVAGSNLNTVAARSLDVPVANINTLVANVTNATTVNVGAATVSYDTSSPGFENLKIAVGGSSALQLYNSDQRALFAGGVVTNSVKSTAGQQLVLQSNDPTSTVIVAGNLFVQGTTTEIATSTLSVNSKTIIVARSNTASADADILADKSGLVVELPVSGYERSLLWNYNQGGSNYAPTTAGAKSSDGSAYWEFVGGNLVLTRNISSSSHIGYNFSSASYAADGVATRVSYRFAIGDDESLNLEKIFGTNLSAAGGAIGSVGVPVGTFDVPPPMP